jgi:O-antigen ligase
VTPERLRAALRFGVLALLLLSPLPYGSVRYGAVLAIELTAAALGLVAILLIGRDEDASAAVPKASLAICLGVIALGIFQTVPLPFSIAEKFNPTVALVRPLIPYLGLDHPPVVSWSVAAPETTDALLRFIAYVLIGLAAAVAFDTERSRRRFAVVLVVAAVFQAVYGSGEYLSGRQHIFGFAKKYYLDSATGTFINRNHFATLLAIVLPFALVLAIPKATSDRTPDPTSWRRRFVALADGGGLGRLLAVAASALIWLGLLLSHSRAGLAAALVGASIVLFRFRATRAARWAQALGAGVLLLLLTIETAQAPGERFLTLKDDIEDTAGRPAVWRAAMELVRERPMLGWGFGTFERAFPTVQSANIEMHYDHAHNDWLEWAIEGGVLALGVAITLLGVALRNTWRTARATTGAATFSIAFQAAIAALAVHAAFDFSLRIPAMAVMGSALMGMALARPLSAAATRVAANVFEVSLAGRISRDGS